MITDTPHSSMSVLDALARAQPGMTSAQQRVAAYFLKHAHDLGDASAKSLCRRLGTSEPVIFAVCRAAGRAGYRELKFDLARELAVHRERRRANGWIAATASPDVPYNGRETSADLVLRIAAVYAESISSVADNLDPRVLAHASRLVAKAGRVVVFGVGISGYLAGMAQYALLRTGVCVTSSQDPSAQLIHLAQLGKGDIAIAMAYMGDQRDVVENLAFARGRDVTTIAITSRPESPLAAHADLVLMLPARPEMSVYLSLGARVAVAELLVLDLLAASVALRRREVFEERAAAVTTILKSRKLKWKTTPGGEMPKRQREKPV